MEKIKVVHDQIGETLTVWFADPQKEYVCEETRDEVILMKDKEGQVIGFELLHYQPEQATSSTITGLSVETVVNATASPL